ncbi:MAG: hypothetical protein GWN84_24300 [Gammaproteobacteria bacterium]|nr:hypothetical protein [Gammaproteobacteria bacterium]NIR85706.1 hypothetical protein [Gammaproteobacteria bacterium]NIR90239.1 hypothetical protein [Gammaproteobacteria bacterium]NIU06840.1 hypothetical protein [Gammaproteobacteria bacterium]NIV53773.1 hypothetical protein [Gammaproteobacteria bacterium]
MSTSLPERIRPLRLARRGERVSGRMPVAGMSRLLESLYSDAGEVAVDLRFHRDDEGHHRITGTVQGTLELVCQRCLGPLRFEVDSAVCLEVVERVEDATQPEEGYEPLLVTEEHVSLRRLVEDELILALPPYPRHAQGVCGIAARYRPVSDAESGGRQRPFDVLAKLKR